MLLHSVLVRTLGLSELPFALLPCRHFQAGCSLSRQDSCIPVDHLAKICSGGGECSDL